VDSVEKTVFAMNFYVHVELYTAFVLAQDFEMTSLPSKKRAQKEQSQTIEDRRKSTFNLVVSGEATSPTMTSEDD